MTGSGGSMSRNKGARWERDVIRWLRAEGVPYAERASGGAYQDGGDILGIPGVYLECKNHARATIPEWLDTLGQRAGPRLGILLVRRHGTTDPARGYAVLHMGTALRLLRDAGYLPPEDSSTTRIVGA